ncbi:MAG: biopolymer transporter ExbD [Puniceicoccales bacterium]|jgi:biopolymer transport protein ExbD|nr:biopolymer transporter ExbD [Puniceicoccales bacterium]
MSLYRPRRRRPEINIVPLIDVMTVLIFFFLMTMRFDEMQSLDISPPTADNAVKSVSNAGGALVVAVNKDGQFFLNGTRVERDALLKRLEAFKPRIPGAPAPHILVVADGRALTKETIFLVDLARKAGLQPRLITKPTR